MSTLSELAVHIFISSINLLYGGHILIAVFYYTEMYILWKYSLVIIIIQNEKLDLHFILQPSANMRCIHLLCMVQTFGKFSKQCM